MKVIRVILMVSAALLMSGYLFAQPLSTPGLTTKPKIKQPPELMVPAKPLQDKRIEGRIKTPPIYTGAMPGGPGCDKCDCNYYTYTAANDVTSSPSSTGVYSNCNRVFYPSGFRSCLVDMSKSYMCRFKNNYPSTNPCPSATERASVNGTLGYTCWSNTDITVANCYDSTYEKATVRHTDVYNTDQLLGYLYLLRCTKTPTPSICIAPDFNTTEADYMSVAKTDHEGVQYSDFCCVYCD